MSVCKFCGTDTSTISTPMGLWDHTQACELTQLRALRDRLVAWKAEQHAGMHMVSMLALDDIIATAEALAATKEV